MDTEAIQNLEDIQDYIAEDDPLAAFEMVNKVMESVETLLPNHPGIGRRGFELPNTRELVVVQTPYIVVYTIEDTTIAIAHFRLGAQLWPTTE